MFGGEAVEFEVIDEDDLIVRCGMDGIVDGAVDLGIGFGHMHLLREVECIETRGEVVGAIDELKMEIIAIGEEVGLVSPTPQVVNERESFGRQIAQHRHPGIDDLLLCGTGSAVSEYLGDESIG